MSIYDLLIVIGWLHHSDNWIIDKFNWQSAVQFNFEYRSSDTHKEFNIDVECVYTYQQMS